MNNNCGKNSNKLVGMSPEMLNGRPSNTNNTQTQMRTEKSSYSPVFVKPTNRDIADTASLFFSKLNMASSTINNFYNSNDKTLSKDVGPINSYNFGKAETKHVQQFGNKKNGNDNIAMNPLISKLRPALAGIVGTTFGTGFQYVKQNNPDTDSTKFGN